jgi:hypothetical protein
MSVLPPDPAHLADIEAIRQLKARYFRHIDCREWDDFEALFTPDATLDGGNGTRHGAHEIRATVESRLDGVETVHHGHTPEITIGRDGTAEGIWAMEDRLVWTGQSAERGEPVGYTGAGHYRERYVRGDDGAWRIASVRLTRLMTQPLPGGHPRR